ncbi:MAG: hypothetical protein IJ599_04215, partial [Alphaproteobacteria bacterium]|nr:hypothetical protein [Alphaproteobacteria bacterium]
GANWNSTVFLNFVAGTYLMNFDIASGKPAYLIDDAGVENVGKTLQEQLFKKYNADYTGQIARAVSDVKIYANRLNLYNFISSMCDIKNSKMPVPEEINAAKLPDLSNYLAPNCSGWFDELSKIGEFSFEAYISGNHDTATKYATAHINHGHFLGYALENWDFVNLDRDMRASFDRDPQVICTYNLPKYISELSEAATHRIFQYKGKTEFEANCLRQNQVHGLANLGNTCWFNTALQTLHFSPTFRRALSKIVEADLQDVPKDKLTQTKDSSMSYQLLRLFQLIEEGGGTDDKTLTEYMNSFLSAIKKTYLYYLFDRRPHDAGDALGCLSSFVRYEKNSKKADEILNVVCIYGKSIPLCTANKHLIPMIKNLDTTNSNVFYVSAGNDGDSLQAHLQSAFKCESGSFDRPCPSCNEKKFLKHRSIERLPRCLLLDIAVTKKKKVSSYPEELLFRDKDGIKTYKLVSAGINPGGHWSMEGRLDNGKWLTIDDVEVSSPRPFSQNPNAKFLIYEQM